MIVAHRRSSFHTRRAIIWCILAVGPWIAFVLSSGAVAELGRAWAFAAMASPVALFLGLSEARKASLKSSGAVVIEDDRIKSERFNMPLSQLESVTEQEVRPRYGITPERFIVFDFTDGRTFRLLAKRLSEDRATIAKSVGL